MLFQSCVTYSVALIILFFLMPVLTESRDAPDRNVQPESAQSESDEQIDEEAPGTTKPTPTPSGGRARKNKKMQPESAQSESDEQIDEEAPQNSTSKLTANASIPSKVAPVPKEEFERYFREWRVRRHSPRGKPNGLIAACRFDLSVLCPLETDRNPYLPSAFQCLTKHRNTLSPSCLAFYDGRNACMQGLKTLNFCRAGESLRRCLVRFKKSFKHGKLLTDDCTQSPFYDSVLDRQG